MKILVLNCGSSSIKYKLYDMDDESVLAQGGVERIGLDNAFLKLTLPNGEKKILIATDDEGNGFRPMYYLISETKGNVDYSTLYGISKEEAEENCVILG